MPARAMESTAVPLALPQGAERHQEQDDALPLDRCVVDMASPEFTGGQPLGIPEMAERGGITAPHCGRHGLGKVPRTQTWWSV
jgi:hypothetical protein